MSTKSKTKVLAAEQKTRMPTLKSQKGLDDAMYTGCKRSCYYIKK